MVTKIAGMIEKKITVGNIATILVFIVGWTISGAVWYTQVQTHIDDPNVHRTTVETQEEIDKRIHLLTDPQNDETSRRLANIERTQEEVLRVLYEVKGRIDHPQGR